MDAEDLTNEAAEKPIEVATTLPTEKPKKAKKKKTSRTVETMYRVMFGNQVRLSEMADRKAALLVQINSIIISIVTTYLVHDFANNQKLLIPAGILVAVCLLTITFALISTKPTFKHQNNNPDGKLDVLFFGDYTTLSVDDYKSAMKTMMTDEKLLNESLIENMYAQGKVLNHKFQLIAIAYWIFMIGFPAAIISFFVWSL